MLLWVTAVSGSTHKENAYLFTDGADLVTLPTAEDFYYYN